MFVVVENSTQTRLHLTFLVAAQDVKPNVAKLKLEMQAEDLIQNYCASGRRWRWKWSCVANSCRSSRSSNRSDRTPFVNRPKSSQDSTEQSCSANRQCWHHRNRESHMSFLYSELWFQLQSINQITSTVTSSMAVYAKEVSGRLDRVERQPKQCWGAVCAWDTSQCDLHCG